MALGRTVVKSVLPYMQTKYGLTTTLRTGARLLTANFQIAISVSTIL